MQQRKSTHCQFCFNLSVGILFQRIQLCVDRETLKSQLKWFMNTLSRKKTYNIRFPCLAWNLYVFISSGVLYIAIGVV